MHRKYNDNIPGYLHNRPRTVVKHCENKLSIANVMTKANVRKSDEGYQVDKKDSDETYTVDITRPKCDCFSWKKLKLPCKHMFSVILYTEETWTSLPETYRNSVYLTLDEIVVGNVKPSDLHQSTLEDPKNDEELEEPDRMSDQAIFMEQPTVDLPKKRKIARTKFAECRELLNEIKSFTFVISDDSVSFKQFFF